MLTTNTATSLILQRIATLTASDTHIILNYPNTEKVLEPVDDSDVICDIGVQFGDVLLGEKTDEGLSPRIGLLAIKVLGKANIGVGRLLDVCNIFERDFHRLVITDIHGDSVFFEEAQTEGGSLTDLNKFAFLVKMPFWIWTQR